MRKFGLFYLRALQTIFHHRLRQNVLHSMYIQCIPTIRIKFLFRKSHSSPTRIKKYTLQLILKHQTWGFFLFNCHFLITIVHCKMLLIFREKSINNLPLLTVTGSLFNQWKKQNKSNLKSNGRKHFNFVHWKNREKMPIEIRIVITVY